MQWARVEREGWTLAQCDHPGRRNRHHEEIPALRLTRVHPGDRRYRGQECEETVEGRCRGGLDDIARLCVTVRPLRQRHGRAPQTLTQAQAGEFSGNPAAVRA